MSRPRSREPSQRAADPLRDADRAAEHAEVLRPPSSSFDARRRHHRLREKRCTENVVRGGNGLGGLGPAPEGMVMWISRYGRHHRRGAVDWGTVVSDDAKGTAGQEGLPSDASLDALSRDQLVALGGRIDGVETVFKEPRWPIAGTKAEKRAERLVATWLLLGGLLGLALLLVFLFWPWEYQPHGSSGSFAYSLATPLYGLTFGGSVLCIADRRGALPEKFIPEEISIQDRHDRLGAGSRRDRPQNRGRQSHRCLRRLDACRRRKLIGTSAAPRPWRVWALALLVAFARGPHQEPVEARGADSRRQEGRAVDLRMDAAVFHGETSTSPEPPASARWETPFTKDAPRTMKPAAWRPSSRGASPTVTAPRWNPAREADRRSDCRPQPGHADPHQGHRLSPGGQTQGPGSFSFGELFAYTEDLLAPGLSRIALRATGLPDASAPATSRSSTRCITPRRSSVRPRARWRSCR